MASPIVPEQHPPLSLDELRKKRAAAVDWSNLLQVYSTLEITDRGPHFCFFQAPHRFAVPGDEQMVAVSPQALFMAFTAVQAAWYGLSVQFAPLPVPGMPGMSGTGPNGPAGPPSGTANTA